MYDLRDVWGWLQKLIARVDKLESGEWLENSSITNGRMRFIGGLLLIDSGGTLTVVGHMNGEGDFVWNGPWALTGAGEITGDVDVTGSIEILDDGRIKVGNVLIEDGKITITAGGNTIIIDGTTGKIIAGNLTIDPSSNGGSIKYATGPEVFAFGGELDLYSTPGGAYVTLNGTAGELHGPGTRWIRVTATGIQIVGLPTKTALETGLPAGVVHADTSGNLFRIVS
jgi:hypothetical protein